MNAYLADILAQPSAMLAALEEFDPKMLRDLARRLSDGRIDRVIVTGMGTSLFGSYPAWQSLAEQGVAAWWIESGELVHSVTRLITPKTLLWVVSQSGRSAEIVALLESASRAAFVLATTNDPNSPAAQKAHAWISMQAGQEHTVATKTYVNTLIVNYLAALSLAGGNLDPARRQAAAAAAAAEAYLQDAEAHISRMEAQIADGDRLIIVGRGISLASAETAGLILKEAAKVAAQGLSAAQFRHGPLELADPTLTVLVFEGEERSARLNRKLVEELQGYGARAFLITGKDPSGLPCIPCPAGEGIGMAVAEVLPIQMLSFPLARRNGFEPGAFRHSGKVTTTE
jgi:glucosamine--fructose-6-phosphate aminotransferase (isomerizing)